MAAERPVVSRRRDNPDTVYASVVDPATRTQTHRQVAVSKFAGEPDPRAAAIAFLERWRAEYLAAGVDPRKTRAAAPGPGAYRSLGAPPSDLELVPAIALAARAEARPFKEAFLSLTAGAPLTATGATCFLFGSSKSGKSHLMTSAMLPDEDVFDRDIIRLFISPSVHAAAYKALPADVVIVRDWRPELIRMLARIQKATRNKYSFALFVDDVIGAREDKALANLVLTLRNSSISTFMALQSVVLLQRSSRFNINSAVFFRINSEEGIEQALRSFLQGLGAFKALSFPAKVALYRALTADHFSLYLNALDNTLTVCRPA